MRCIMYPCSWMGIFLNIYLPVNFSCFPSQMHMFINGDYQLHDKQGFFPKLC